VPHFSARTETSTEKDGIKGCQRESTASSRSRPCSPHQGTALLENHGHTIVGRNALDLSPVSCFAVARVADEHAVFIQRMQVRFVTLEAHGQLTKARESSTEATRGLHVSAIYGTFPWCGFGAFPSSSSGSRDYQRGAEPK